MDVEVGVVCGTLVAVGDAIEGWELVAEGFGLGVFEGDLGAEVFVAAAWLLGVDEGEELFGSDGT